MLKLPKLKQNLPVWNTSSLLSIQILRIFKANLSIFTRLLFSLLFYHIVLTLVRSLTFIEHFLYAKPVVFITSSNNLRQPVAVQELLSFCRWGVEAQRVSGIGSQWQGSQWMRDTGLALGSVCFAEHRAANCALLFMRLCREKNRRASCLTLSFAYVSFPTAWCEPRSASCRFLLNKLRPRLGLCPWHPSPSSSFPI